MEWQTFESLFRNDCGTSSFAVRQHGPFFFNFPTQFLIRLRMERSEKRQTRQEIFTKINKHLPILICWSWIVLHSKPKAFLHEAMGNTLEFFWIIAPHFLTSVWGTQHVLQCSPMRQRWLHFHHLALEILKLIIPKKLTSKHANHRKQYFFNGLNWTPTLRCTLVLEWILARGVKDGNADTAILIDCNKWEWKAKILSILFGWNISQVKRIDGGLRG